MKGSNSNSNSSSNSSKKYHHTNLLGTSRNLTEKFLKYRNNARSSKMGLTAKAGEIQMAPLSEIAQKGDVGVYMEMTPQWMLNADAIKDGMKKLKAMITELKSLHNQGGLVSFSEEQEGSSQSRIAQKTNQIKQQIRDLDKIIQTIGNMQENDEADSKIIQQVRKELAGGLLQLSNDFQREEMRYLDKRKQKKQMTTDPITDGYTPEELNQADIFQQQMFIQKEMEAQIDMIAQRDTEITYVVETIAELSSIMKDLAMLVQEQGTVLDRIDYNIEQVAASVEAGVEQLVGAQKSQKASQMTWCIICLAVAVFVMVLALVAKNV